MPTNAKQSRKAQSTRSSRAESDGAHWQATEIVPNLYLGPVSAASSDSFLNSAGITHILSIGSTPAGSPRSSVTYLRLPLKDSPTVSLEGAIDAASFWIDEALLKNEGQLEDISSSLRPKISLEGRRKKAVVFIHCSAAVSRSPSVLAGYLMKSRQMSLFDALGLLVRARPSVSPNSGFLEQLRNLEEKLYGRVTLDHGLDQLPRTKADREAMFSLDMASASVCS